MTGDDRFERDLRAGLRDLAREPAPDNLLRDVQRIPMGDPGMTPSPSRRAFGLIGTLAAAAVIVVVAGVVILSRPGSTVPVGASATPSIAAPSSVPTATSSESTSPSTEPSASESSPPSVEPSTSGPTESASPSSVPSASAAPTATSAPSAPSASTAPSPSGGHPAGGPVQSGFQPVSVTFVSPTQGWALGVAPCAGQACQVAVVRTLDGGRTWSDVPAPPAVLSAWERGLAAQMSPGSGVSGLRFATPLDGWAYGPDLWATHDGGTTWTRATIPGAATDPIVALEAAAGSVHAVVYDIANGASVRIATSPVTADTWTLADATVDIGAGPVPSTQLVLAHSLGWVLQVNRTVVGGLALVDGQWKTWTPACGDVVGPAVLAASSGSDVVASCDVGTWSTPKGTHLFRSHDNGGTFSETGATIPIQGSSAIALAGSSILVGGTTDQGSTIVRSADGGKTWRQVLDAGQAGVVYLGFTTPTQGVAITTQPSNTASTFLGTLYMSHDAGATWTKVSF